MGLGLGPDPAGANVRKCDDGKARSTPASLCAMKRFWKSQVEVEDDESETSKSTIPLV
jgi:hypothetical protein